MSLQFIGNVWINLQLVLLLPLIITQVYATTFVQFGDTAGVAYPTIEDRNIFLREAYMQIDTISKWERATAGFEPHHAIEMNLNTEYVIQNDSEEANLPINIPLMTPLDDSSLSFTFNDLAVNYSNAEYANLRQTGSGVNLYTLDLIIPEGTSVLEVNVTSRGIASSETDFTIMLEEASRWVKPIEKLVISSTHANGLITSYSIPPSKTTLKAATWEFSNNIPTQDLTIRWKITESPIGTDIDVAKVQPPDPLIPPIIAIIVGGAIIGFIAYIRVKRNRSGSVN